MRCVRQKEPFSLPAPLCAVPLSDFDDDDVDNDEKDDDDDDDGAEDARA